MIPGNLTPHKFHCTLMRPVTQGSFSLAVTRKLNSCGWPSGESTCLPPMWPGFNSALGVICGLSLLVLCTPVFPSHQKPTFDLN